MKEQGETRGSSDTESSRRWKEENKGKGIWLAGTGCTRQRKRHECTFWADICWKMS